MHAKRDVASQEPLRYPLSRILGLLLQGDADLFHGKESEQLQVPFDVAIIDIDPELIKLVRTGAPGIEPDIASLALSELGPGCVSDEGEYQAVRLAPFALSNQLDSRGDIDPAFGPAADALLLQHEAEREMLAGVSEELHQRQGT